MSAEGPNVQRRLAAVLAADVVGYNWDAGPAQNRAA